MTVKSQPKVKTQKVSFSLRESLKPLIKEFSDEAEKAGFVFYFEIPLNLPDRVIGIPQELKNDFTKTFQAFFKKALKAEHNPDQLIEGEIEYELPKKPAQALKLSFVFETINLNKSITNSFDVSVVIDKDVHMEGTMESSVESVVDKPISLSHLNALFFTTPERYPTLTSLFDSWEMPTTVLTSIPKTLPEHDIIFLTDQVGSLNGFDVAAKLKTKAPRSHIIFISANPKRGDADLCLELGIQSYLSHPVEPIELWEAIKRVLQMPSTSNKISELITRHSLREEDSKLNILLIPSGDMDPVDLGEIGSLLLAQGHRVTMITAPEDIKSLPTLSKSFDLIVTDPERRDQLYIQKIQTPIVTFDPDTFDGNQKIILEKIEHLI